MSIDKKVRGPSCSVAPCNILVLASQSWYLVDPQRLSIDTKLTDRKTRKLNLNPSSVDISLLLN